MTALVAAVARLVVGPAPAGATVFGPPLTHPDDVAAHLELVQRLRGREVPWFALEHRCVLPDGGVVWVNALVSVLDDGDDGAPGDLLTLVTDVTTGAKPRTRPGRPSASCAARSTRCRSCCGSAVPTVSSST